MSSTNVHSEKISNLACAGAQIIPKESELEIPPKTAKLGPTRLGVINGEYIEIPVEESVLNKENGQLINKKGNVIANFNKSQIKNIDKAKKSREKNKVAKVDLDQEK